MSDGTKQTLIVKRFIIELFPLYTSFVLIILSQSMHAAISFKDPKSIASPPTAAIALGDLDGDNHQDIIIGIVGFFTPSRITWIRNDGQKNASFQAGGEIDLLAFNLNIVSLNAADMDKDEDIDIVSGCYTGNHVVWYENTDDGTTFTKRIVSKTLPNTHSVITTDLNGDGFQDIIAASYEVDVKNNPINSRITWFRNNGASPPSFTSHTLSTAALGPTSIFAADVNGDGKLDVIANSPGDGRIYYFRNNGGIIPSFFPLTISQTGSSRRTSMHAADLDGDGDRDILYGKTSDGRQWWYENRGNASPPFIQRHFSTDIPQLGYYIASADFNKDGRQDLATGFVSTANWLENIGGSPPEFVSFSSQTSGSSMVVSIADMNGDNDADIVFGYRVPGSFPLGGVLYFENLFQETNAVPASNWALYE